MTDAGEESAVTDSAVEPASQRRSYYQRRRAAALLNLVAPGAGHARQLLSDPDGIAWSRIGRL